MFEDYSKYPRHYYKYSQFNKYTISSLIHCEFWFSDPQDFNDPYDCGVELDYDFNEKELRSWYIKTNPFYTDLIKNISNPITQRQIIKSRYQNQLDDNSTYDIIDRIHNRNGMLYSNELIENRISEYKNEPEAFIGHIKDDAKREIQSYRILCLSRKNNSSTMWAHYADNHKGICIKYDSKEDEQFFTFPLKVDYVGRYPSYNYINEWEKHKAASFILRTKHRSWNYEQEYRVVKHIKTTNFRERGLLKINRAAIKGIYFGLHSDRSDIQLFQEINKKYYDNNIKAFKAVKKGKSFDLDFEPIM